MMHATTEHGNCKYKGSQMACCSHRHYDGTRPTIKGKVANVLDCRVVASGPYLMSTIHVQYYLVWYVVSGSHEVRVHEVNYSLSLQPRHVMLIVDNMVIMQRPTGEDKGTF